MMEFKELNNNGCHFWTNWARDWSQIEKKNGHGTINHCIYIHSVNVSMYFQHFTLPNPYSKGLKWERGGANPGDHKPSPKYSEFPSTLFFFISNTFISTPASVFLEIKHIAKDAPSLSLPLSNKFFFNIPKNCGKIWKKKLNFEKNFLDI